MRSEDDRPTVRMARLEPGEQTKRQPPAVKADSRPETWQDVAIAAIMLAATLAAIVLLFVLPASGVSSRP